MTAWLRGPHQMVETMSVRNAGAMRSIGTVQRHATWPVNTGSSAPTVCRRTIDLMPSAPTTRSARQGSPCSNDTLTASGASSQRHRARIQHQCLRIERMHGGAQCIVQIVAVQLEVGRTVPLFVGFAQRQAVQQLAVVETAELERLGPHRMWLERCAQTQAIEHLHRVGAHLDTGTDLAEHGRLFGDANAVPALQQRGRGRQAAEAGADDRDVEPRRHRDVNRRGCAAP